MHGWSVAQQMIVYKLIQSQIALKIFKSKIEARGVQTLHFICDWFGWKLWLRSIQNHARHRFQAFARRHVKSLCCLPLLCCSIWIWTVAFSWGSDPAGCISFATDWAAIAFKLWLWSIQNHTRRRFKAFARRHLKSLCSSIWIWAD